MSIYKDQQAIGQLEKRKGGYFYLTIPAQLVNTYENKRYTRLICTLDEKITFQCGLNHLGDGNFFIILSGANLKSLGKSLGDLVIFELVEDPNPLGVDMPEVLEVVLEQDAVAKNKFEALSLGKKRNIIHSVKKIKDIDKQVNRIIELIDNADKPRVRDK
jgi:hypothetical protein